MDPKTRANAETRFQKAQRAQEAGRTAWTQYETEAKAVDVKTAKLKAERLARDAAEGEGAAKRTATRKAGPKKGVGSY